MGPGLDHMGAEEWSKGPKFSPIGILIIRWWAQLCQNRGTVFQEEALHVVSSDAVNVAQHGAIQDTADPLPLLLQPGQNQSLNHIMSQLGQACDGAVTRGPRRLLVHPALGEGLGDPGLDVVRGCAEMLADLGYQAGSEVPECPVIVHIWPQAQLSAHDAGHHSWNQLMHLREKCQVS